ncbi:hypothetical protein O6X71_20360 [Sphingomonas faeni]
MPASPYQPANIKRVVENAGRLFRVAADRRGIPLPATWARHAVGIQLGRYLDGRSAGRELGEYALDDGGLRLVDLEQATNTLTAVIKADDPPVAVGATTGAPPRKHCRLHAAQGLVDEVFEEDRSQQPGNRELDLVDMALAHGVQLHTVVGQLFAEPRDILRIARKPVERFADDQVDCSRLDVRQQFPQARPITAIAGLFGVMIRRHHGAANIGDELHARFGLINTRCGRLHRGRVAPVEDDAGGRAHQHGRGAPSVRSILSGGRAGIIGCPRGGRAAFIMVGCRLLRHQPDELRHADGEGRIGSVGWGGANRSGSGSHP